MFSPSHTGIHTDIRRKKYRFTNCYDSGTEPEHKSAIYVTEWISETADVYFWE